MYIYVCVYVCVYVYIYLYIYGPPRWHYSPATNAGDLRDTGLIPGWERSPGRGHDNSLQYSCLENHMDRRAWWTTVFRVAKE